MKPCFDITSLLSLFSSHLLSLVGPVVVWSLDSPWSRIAQGGMTIGGAATKTNRKKVEMEHKWWWNVYIDVVNSVKFFVCHLIVAHFFVFLVFVFLFISLHFISFLSYCRYYCHSLHCLLFLFLFSRVVFFLLSSFFFFVFDRFFLAFGLINFIRNQHADSTNRVETRMKLSDWVCARTRNSKRLIRNDEFFDARVVVMRSTKNNTRTTQNKTKQKQIEPSWLSDDDMMWDHQQIAHVCANQI